MKPTLNSSPLEEQLSMLKQICNTVGAYIFAKDLAGRYTYVNQAVLDLFEKTEEDVIGLDDSHFFDLAISNEIIENDRQAMQQRKTVVSEEYNHVKSSDEVRIYRSIKKPIFDEKNQVIGICGISTDITEEKRLQNLVDEQKALLDVVLDNMQAHVYMKDDQRRFLYVNSKVAELFGMPVDEIIGQYETDILPKETADHFYQSDALVFKTNEVQRIEETMVDDNQKTHHYLSVKVPITTNSQRALIGFSTDVSELYRLKEQFRFLANTDPLTTLYNRRYFTEHAEREFARAKREHSALALLSIDIDFFKSINDLFGHPSGDKVLKALSKKLLENIRTEDVVARIGGEEFAMLLPNSDAEKAAKFAERIRLELHSYPFTTEENHPIEVTVSIGVTLINEADTCFETMFSRVDKALYHAKEQGRNQVYVL